MKRNNGKDACLGENGSTMLWSLMILTLLLVLSVTFMTMAAASLTKAKKETAYSQAYYTSKGMVDVAVAALFTGNSKEAAGEVLMCVDEAAARLEDYESCGQDTEEWELVEGLPAEMGECRMRICYRVETDALYISACTRKGGFQRIVTLELERQTMDQSTEEVPDDIPEADGSQTSAWRPRHYTEGI